MEVKQNIFYITLFSNASDDVYLMNSRSSFTTRLPIDLGSASDWEVGLSEITYQPSQRQIIQSAVIDVISALNVLIYCDLIAPQLVGSEIICLLRTIICNWESTCFINFIIFLWRKRNLQAYIFIYQYGTKRALLSI